MTTRTADFYLEVGEKLVAGLNAGDMEAILAQLHPSIEVFECDSIPYGGTWRGKDGFVALFEQIFKIGSLSIQSAKAHAIENGVMMELTLSFTSHKNGEVYQTSLIEIDRFEDDLIREIDVFYKDTAAINAFAARQA